jgi:hypothetical protein
MKLWRMEQIEEQAYMKSGDSRQATGGTRVRTQVRRKLLVGVSVGVWL